jgi:AcrR family transcriptional regulator
MTPKKSKKTPPTLRKSPEIRVSAGKAGASARQGRTSHRPRTNAQWSAATTDLLLRCAREEFAGQGYDGASVDRIAERAGLTKGAVYYHFGSKPALFREVFERMEVELVERIEGRATSVDDPLEGLILGCETFVDVIVDPELTRVILIDGPRVLGLDAWREIDARLGQQSLREGIDACIAAGRMKPVDPGALTHLLSGAMNEAVLVMSETDRDPARRAAIHATLRALLRGLEEN